jgi:hypothetical protein
MPNTRPDTPFIDGECSACISYRNRANVDWEARGRDLVRLLDRHGGRCIVPSSGGKDSCYQVKTLQDLGADVTVVTATTCHLTQVGRKNIDNLARYARTIEVSPNKTVRAKLNRLGLEIVGDISWPEHVSIFTTPFNMAHYLGINLIFYGENPQNQYGGPLGSDEARRLTERWRSEFGGFLGLRPVDMIGQLGITECDMRDYELMVPSHSMVEAHFLGAYVPWDSQNNWDVAQEMGMHRQWPGIANFWSYENLDNAQTGLHDYLMFLKYGYGRGCAQASVDVRYGRLTRDAALEWVNNFDGYFPTRYMGVTATQILGPLGLTVQQFHEVANKFKCLPIESSP